MCVSPLSLSPLFEELGATDQKKGVYDVRFHECIDENAN